MRRRRSYIRRPYVLALLAIALLTVPLATAAGDAVLDAKRTAAAKLLKDGKPADAQKLYEEIIAQDDSVWSDHYALAKMYDKAGETPKAVEAYQKTVNLLTGNAKASSERSALSDAEKRLKVLDTVSDELDAAIARFSKELQELSKAAVKAKSRGAYDRINQLQVSLALAGGAADWAEIRVSSTKGWVDTGVDVRSGESLVFTAKGVWSHRKTDPTTFSDADGVPGSTLPSNGLPAGMLIARVGPEGKTVAVGVSGVLLLEDSGRLQFSLNDRSPSDNSGELVVRVRRK